MKINQIIVSESMGGTVAGAVATVESPMGVVQKRTQIKGLEPAAKVMRGKTKKKGPYQNSLSENKKTSSVQEAKLDEDDIIIVPGQSIKRKTGFVPHGQSRVDHEVDMARSDLIACYKNAKAIYSMLKDRSEEEGLEGWVQEKLIKASDYLNAVKEYLDGRMAQESIPNGGVIAGGGVGESIAEEQIEEAGYSPYGRPNPYGNNIKSPVNQEERIKALVNLMNKALSQGNKDLANEIATNIHLVKTGQLYEKAVSKAQQRFMGMVHAVQKGEMKAPSKAVASAAKGMSKKAGHDFAATKHKGLPEKVKKDKK